MDNLDFKERNKHFKIGKKNTSRQVKVTWNVRLNRHVKKRSLFANNIAYIYSSPILHSYFEILSTTISYL